MSLKKPLRVALVNDHELIVKGLAAMFANYPDLITIVELNADTPVIHEVDIALYDSFAPHSPTPDEVAALVRNRAIGRVVVYTLHMSTEAIQTAAALGVSGYLSKDLPARDLVHALQRVHAGHRVVSSTSSDVVSQIGGDWPGRVEGLSNREAEVLTLIVRGLSNQEICERLYLTNNSVKSYIRTSYAKIGVTRRSQAVKWGLEHGFGSPPRRITTPAA